jgi:two-component system sensor histidine kinase YesM
MESNANSSFSRYLFRTDFTLVSLHDELEQVKHYISMQELRYSDMIFYVLDIEPELYTYHIPAMLIQTLVENSLKHGMDENKGISIFVQCKVFQNDGHNGLQISVEDNGSGFPIPVLAAVNDPLADQSTLGFGLQTIKATLGLIYKESVSIQAENIPGSGAKVVITILKSL